MNGSRHRPRPARSAGPARRASTGCSGCAVRSPGWKCRSRSSARRGRCVARSVTSARIVKAWDLSLPACAVPSTPEARSSSPLKAHDVTRGGFEGLDACVHCGFCLQACPTFLATGDESDSPRGRIELMRALERGELPVTDPALTYHLDRCLGCRGCEPVCPSGVRYGQGLEAARSRITAARGTSRLTRLALWALTTPGVSGVVYWW